MMIIGLINPAFSCWLVLIYSGVFPQRAPCIEHTRSGKWKPLFATNCYYSINLVLLVTTYIDHTRLGK